MKFDENGQLKWNKYYSTGNFYRIKEINDTLLMATSAMSFEDDPALTVIDTSGNLIPYFSYQSNFFNTLTYSYNNNNLSQFLNDFMLNDSNQALIYTSIEHPAAPNYKPVIIKTDASFYADCFTAGADIYDSIPPGFVIDTTVSFSSFSLTATDISSYYNVIDLNLNNIDICSLLSIENVLYSESYMTISPNPSAGNFKISMERSIEAGSIEIINSMGERIHSDIIFNESEKKVNLGEVAVGIYFVKLFDGKKSYCRKLIVQ